MSRLAQGFGAGSRCKRGPRVCVGIVAEAVEVVGDGRGWCSSFRAVMRVVRSERSSSCSPACSCSPSPTPSASRARVAVGARGARGVLSMMRMCAHGGEEGGGKGNVGKRGRCRG